MPAAFRTIDDLDVKGARVLVRVDFNVPMDRGVVTETTRLEAAVPTVSALSARGAKVILLAHFDRPKGKRVPAMSLAPVAPAFAHVLGQPVAFADDCIGAVPAAAIAAMAPGSVILLENTRFHPGEEDNDPAFAKALAALGDAYVNDAFSAAHRAHASTEGLAHLLPAAAGRSMQQELDYLTLALSAPKRPVMAVVGGAKVSSKLDVLRHLVERVDMLVVGGGMANTFLLAQGHNVGKSLAEADLAPVAREILERARAAGCDVILPTDVVVAQQFAAHAPSTVKPADAVADGDLILDVGPDSVDAYAGALARCATLIWNGPLGAFETPPFHTATIEFARFAARQVADAGLCAVAGGGDTVAALQMAGVTDGLTYVSTAGGAFLEWMEGKALPGVDALRI